MGLQRTLENFALLVAEKKEHENHSTTLPGADSIFSTPLPTPAYSKVHAFLQTHIAY